MRKILSRIVATLLFFVVVVFGLQLIASETGEVVVLQTTAEDEVHTTRLWVVDLEESPWVRADPGSAWFARLRANPEVRLARGDGSARYVAEPRPERREEVNALIANKYGWRERWLDLLLGGRDEAIPVRLRPAPGEV